MADRAREISVVKLGGSVLTGLPAYATAAAWVASRVLSAGSERMVAVVSAELGQTDALAREAVALHGQPDPEAVDLLWSTGELQSVARLVLALHAINVRAAGLNAHETGIRVATDSPGAAINTLALRAALARHSVVVVPGFLGIWRQRIVTLGRGGSDLSAVRLAAALHAGTCALIKDVDGYFTADPAADPRARPIRALTYAQALAMADRGCSLVQRQALEEARRAHVPLIIRSMTGSGTVVSAGHQPPREEPIPDGIRHTDHSCRPGHRTGDGSGGCADLPDHDLSAARAR